MIDQENAKRDDAAPLRHPALPPPQNYAPRPAARLSPATALDRLMSFIERAPWRFTVLTFLALTGLHILFLNLSGAASLVFIEGKLFATVAAERVNLVLLALIAFALTLPTLLNTACLPAYAELRGTLNIDSRAYADFEHRLADPMVLLRLVFGLFWAAILTPVFGSLLTGTISGTIENPALLTVWMYIRLSLIFGLLGSSITYAAMLHYRLRQGTNGNLKVDLFDLSPLDPLTNYAKKAGFYFMILLALGGPAIVRADALMPSAMILALGLSLVVLATKSALWGGRKSIRSAKQTALTELQAYAREIWRRSYFSGRIVEAVAIPAMASMLTVRDELRRLSNWPGGWTVMRFLALASLLPLTTWFGLTIVEWVLDFFSV